MMFSSTQGSSQNKHTICGGGSGQGAAGKCTLKAMVIVQCREETPRQSNLRLSFLPAWQADGYVHFEKDVTASPEVHINIIERKFTNLFIIGDWPHAPLALEWFVLLVIVVSAAEAAQQA